MNPQDGNGPRVVPVYAITGGRTRSRGPDLEFETLVTTTEHGIASRGRLRFELARIIDVCRAPVSVVEVAARLQVPIGVARVLVSDLHADGMLTIHGSAVTSDGRPRTEVLERLLNGLRTR
ncbi:MAG TPA: DUF742 domain-containing protein [Acidimicrobiales bacterium]|nr:DUF742 domain-containing protein [Acidimicrobiales bacterium]